MTFDELGIPFPLYAADASTNDDHVGVGTCSLCARSDRHVFTLEHDGALVVRCPVCAVDRCARDAACEVCDTAIDLPADPIHVCYDCFRAGRAVFARHTTEGFVDLEAVQRGLPSGKQGFASEHFATVEVDLRPGAPRPPPATPYPEHERKVRHFAARIPVDQMIELLRTPMPTGEWAWPFHCARPMVFIGSWDPDDDHPAFLDEVFAEHPRLWCHVWRCPSCEALTWQGDR